VETITDAVSIHSIKKAEYAKRLAQGQLGHVTLLDHFISVRHSFVDEFEVLTDHPKSYGDPSSAKFARAQRNFTKSLAGRGSHPSGYDVSLIPSTTRLFLDHPSATDKGPT